MDCNPPGSSVHGILQARVLDWVAIPSSWGWGVGVVCYTFLNDLTKTLFLPLYSNSQSIMIPKHISTGKLQVSFKVKCCYLL